MFKQWANQNNITLKHGSNGKILLHLFWNQLFVIKLKIYKWLHGIHHPIIHYYAVCWNEEKMLPFMFDYYGQFVDHFTIYDNYSDDSSEAIILSHPNTEIKKFSMGGEINDYIYQDIKNNCWKRSRGKADYVIVGDIDEFIYHPDILHALNMLKGNHFSIVKPYGYNMYSMNFPNHSKNKLITNQVQRGLRHPMMDKCVLFNPHAIVEINYKPGAHECYPWGRVKLYRNEAFKLLHYKNIGLEELISRNRLYAKRLSKKNIENDYGTPYLRNEETIISEFREQEKKATVII